MKVLVLGAAGMLGHAVFGGLSAISGLTVYGTVRAAGREPFFELDIRDSGGLQALLGQLKPDIVINCAGTVKQRQEASDLEQLVKVNALFPHQLALACSSVAARVIHFSTDCVFSGQEGGYTELDAPDAIDLYGRTKHWGELPHAPHCLTLRTSVIGHQLTGSYGLLEWFLGQRGTVHGYSNAVFSGLTTREVAKVLADVVLRCPDLQGLYHLAGAPVSKLELLRMLRAAYATPVEIVPETQTAYDRSLDATSFLTATGYQPPPWQQMIEEMARHGR